MAGLRFTELQSRPMEFLDFTSVTLDEFQQLVPPFEAAFQVRMTAWRMDGKPRTARRFTVYQNCPLPTPEDRLLFILTYLKTFALQVVQGRLFGMGQSKANQLSLSRLNHWLPRAQAHPKVMQGTADFHHQIADAFLPQTDPVFDNATALDAAVDMFDPQPTVRERLIRSVLLPCQLLATGFLGRHEDCHVGQREGQETQILQQPAPCGQGIRRRVGNAFIMHAASPGITEKEDDEQGIDQQDIFYRMVLFLAAITLGLFSRILGADDAPLGAVMGKRGEVGTTAGAATRGGRSSSTGITTVAASASDTPNRCARAVRDRVGASPRARSAASNTGRRT